MVWMFDKLTIVIYILHHYPLKENVSQVDHLTHQVWDLSFTDFRACLPVCRFLDQATFAAEIKNRLFVYARVFACVFIYHVLLFCVVSNFCMSRDVARYYRTWRCPCLNPGVAIWTSLAFRPSCGGWGPAMRIITLEWARCEDDFKKTVLSMFFVGNWDESQVLQPQFLLPFVLSSLQVFQCVYLKRKINTLSPNGCMWEATVFWLQNLFFLGRNADSA